MRPILKFHVAVPPEDTAHYEVPGSSVSGSPPWDKEGPQPGLMGTAGPVPALEQTTLMPRATFGLGREARGSRQERQVALVPAELGVGALGGNEVPARQTWKLNFYVDFYRAPTVCQTLGGLLSRMQRGIRVWTSLSKSFHKTFSHSH